MKGKIIAYSENVNAGVINGHDGEIYIFTKSDWEDEFMPAVNKDVDFRNEVKQARKVKISRSK